MNRPEGISPEVWSKAVDLVMDAKAERVPYYSTSEEIREARLADATAIALAIQSSVEAERAACRGAIRRANELLGGIETPLMQGDCLAVTLCGVFDDGGPSDDDTGWSKAALAGYEQVTEAIRRHYTDAIKGA